MLFRVLLAAVFFFIFSSATLNAHPVTFKNGTAVWTFSMLKRQDFRANYTFHRKWSLGTNYSLIDLESANNTHYSWLQLNHLLKRWNTKNSQANIYLAAGLGGFANPNDSGVLGHAEIQADYETRRIYFGVNHQSLFAKKMSHRTKITPGWSPYLAGTNDLHTWIITHMMIQPNQAKEVIVAPGLRFFYKNFFAEAGSSFKGDWFVTAMFHF